MSTTARLIADDLFAGAGGWDVAADWLDIHARGVENMPEARATRDAAGLTTVHDDVWTYKPRYRVRWSTPAEVALGAPASRLVLEAAGLIASPPCQTFSQAGKGSGRKALNDVLDLMADVPTLSLPELRERGQVFADERTALVLTPLWFALHHPYRWLAWEQVPTVLPVWEACAEVLRAHGWHVWTGVLNAEQYGVPQTRKRAVLIASRDHEVTAPTPTHSRYYSRTPSKLDPGVAKWVSMAEALGWGLYRRPSPTITGGGTESGGAEPIAKLARWTERPDWLDRGHAHLESNYSGGTAEDGSRDLGRRSLDAPAPTITGRSHKWAPGHADGEPCTCRVVFTATNPRPNSAERPPCTPAPTLAFGHEQPRWTEHPAEDPDAWEYAGAGRTAVDTAGQQRRGLDQPAHTVTGAGTGYWCLRERTPDGLERFAQQSDNVPDYGWPDDRPATTVAGRDLVQAPGATANRFNGSTKSRNDGVRVSVAEAAVLQSFPPDHAWQGNKGKQYLQVGNAVPCLLAMAILCAALGEPYVPPTMPAPLPEQPPLDLPVEAIAYRNGTHEHAAVRPADRPAPTVMFGARSNRVTWEAHDTDTEKETE